MSDDHTATPRKHAPRGRIKAVDPMSASNPMRVTLEPVKCSATSRQGKPCAQYAIPGATVCHYHGGKAPQVLAKAHERLMALQFPAIHALTELIEDAAYPSTRLGAAKDVLDRTMGRAVDRVAVESDSRVEIIIRKPWAEE